jgi:hypothetical protein
VKKLQTDMPALPHAACIEPITIGKEINVLKGQPEMTIHSKKIQMRFSAEQYAEVEQTAAEQKVSKPAVARTRLLAEPIIDSTLSLEEALRKSEREAIMQRSLPHPKLVLPMKLDVVLTPEQLEVVEARAAAKALSRAEYGFRQVTGIDTRIHSVHHDEKVRLDRATFLLSNQ